MYLFIFPIIYKSILSFIISLMINSIHPSNYLSKSSHPSVYPSPSIHLWFTHSSFHPSISLSIFLSFHPPSLYPSIPPSFLYLSIIHPFSYCILLYSPSIHLFLFIHLHFYSSISLSSILLFIFPYYPSKCIHPSIHPSATLSLSPEEQVCYGTRDKNTPAFLTSTY